MKNNSKSKEQLLLELEKKNKRIADLEKTEAESVKEDMLLSESEKRFNSIVEYSPMGFHIYSLESDGKLVFVGANPAADELLGVDNRQFIGKTIEEAFPPLAGTEVPEKYKEVASLGIRWQTDQVIYKDEEISGAYEVYAFQTLPEKMVALFMDITERKKTEVELEKHREHLEELVEERTREVEEKNRKLSEQMKIFVGRELTIRDLQNKVKALGGK